MGRKKDKGEWQNKNRRSQNEMNFFTVKKIIFSSTHEDNNFLFLI